MLRMARLHCDADAAPTGVAELATAGALDLLQLDYARPRLAPAEGPAPPELPEFPRSFADVLRSLCKTLFLEPDFRVIASAGWSNAYVSVEHVAAALVAGGSPNLPVSAVRGSNVMGILEYLVADGLRLDHAETHAPFSSLKRPILAADLHLGAGPLTTALAEGGRVVIAGCYDEAAPMIAMGMCEFGWRPSDLACLAGAAAAARAASWSHPHDANWLATAGRLPAVHRHPRLELGDRGEFTIDFSEPVDSAEATRLLQWLCEGTSRDRHHLHADVQFDATSAAATQRGPTQLHIAGCQGAAADNHWWLHVLYHAGFFVETMIEFSPGTQRELRRQVAEAFLAHFCDEEDGRSSTTVQELATAETDDSVATWLHVARRGTTHPPCAELAEHVAKFATANRDFVRLPAGRPTVMAECGLWPTRVPRDAVDLAVDTRPAREWE